MDSASLPCPCPKDNYCNALPVVLSVNDFKSLRGSEPGVIINMIGVSLDEFLNPSAISNNGGST